MTLMNITIEYGDIADLICESLIEDDDDGTRVREFATELARSLHNYLPDEIAKEFEATFSKTRADLISDEMEENTR